MQYYTGRGVERDLAAAAKWLQKPAEGGDVRAQALLAALLALLADASAAPDYRTSFGWLQKAAAQGDANAQSLLAMYYLAGRGTARDNDQALAWARRAADQGHVGGRCMLEVGFADGSWDSKAEGLQGWADLLKAAARANSPECREWGYSANLSVDVEALLGN